MEIINEIECFAGKQFDNGGNDAIGFDHCGQWIADPWMDNSGRTFIGIEKAFDLYGAEKILSYISEAADHLKISSGIPEQGSILATIKDINGNHIEIWMHGLDDFAACFIEEDWSVRGPSSAVASEIDSSLTLAKKRYCQVLIRNMPENEFKELFTGLRKILEPADTERGKA